MATAMTTIGAGCVSEKSEETKMSELDKLERLEAEGNGLHSPEVLRFVDREAGVVIYEGLGGGGVTSVPLSETDLE
jgi:hypothetical protein